MPGIPGRYSHFVFGVIQSGLTTVVATGIASFPEPSLAQFLTHGMLSWLIARAAMMPIVLPAAPGIRALTVAITRDDAGRQAQRRRLRCGRSALYSGSGRMATVSETSPHAPCPHPFELCQTRPDDDARRQPR